MNQLKDTLVFWTTILGTVVAFFGLIQSSTWLTGLAVLMVTISISAILYARWQHDIIVSSAIKVEGRSIDSLNLASLRRRFNRSLVIQDARQLARIEGEDLTVIWQYSGYCRADHEAVIEFSIDSDNNIPFHELVCFAYDLLNDPQRSHKIRPILIGPDGISKKIAVPLLNYLAAQEPFSVLVTCKLPGCMKAGVEYYTSSLSFEQERVQRYSVRMIFVRDRPEWLRLYECGPSGETRLVKDLRPLRENENSSEYLDIAENIPAKLARIYLFRRADYIASAALNANAARA